MVGFCIIIFGAACRFGRFCARSSRFVLLHPWEALDSRACSTEIISGDPNCEISPTIVHIYLRIRRIISHHLFQSQRPSGALTEIPRPDFLRERHDRNFPRSVALRSETEKKRATRGDGQNAKSGQRMVDFRWAPDAVKTWWKWTIDEVEITENMRGLLKVVIRWCLILCRGFLQTLTNCSRKAKLAWCFLRILMRELT